MLYTLNIQPDIFCPYDFTVVAEATAHASGSATSVTPSGKAMAIVSSAAMSLLTTAGILARTLEP